MSALTSPSSPTLGPSSADEYEGAIDIARAWRAGLAPDPDLTVSVWADRHRVLSPRGSNEPGPWRTQRTPYLKQIMDALSPAHPAQRVVFCKGAQVGATEAGNNWIGYVIDQSPGPMLAVQPTVDLAKRFSQQRIASLIEYCPSVRTRVAPSRSRDSGNRMLSKDFPGGMLVITGANSAVGLRSMPVRYLFLDEIDAYPASADDEGEPVALAEARTRTFSWRRKVFLASTPTVKGVSRIEREYEASDQRRFFVPCPHCDGMQWLKFAQLRWEKGRPETATYHCELCGAAIAERHKTQMLEAGEWRPTAASVDPLTIGFHLSSLYSPVGWRSWAAIARDWEAAQDNEEAKRGVVNLDFGEAYELRGEAPESDKLMLRREDYPLQRVPPGALVITAGVDVQARYLQYEVVAWGEGLASWSIDFGTIEGDTADDAVWAELDRFVSRTYPDALGTPRPIEMTAVDSGYNTQRVYAFCRRLPRVMAVKGMPGPLAPLVGLPQPQEVNLRGKRIVRGVMLWPIGDWQLKAELYGNLRKEGPKDGAPTFPPGYCHFSTAHDQGFFEQLTAEHLVTRTFAGREKKEWLLLPGRRNEVLDCRKMARAAAEYLGLSRLSESEWRVLAANRGAPRQGQLALDGVLAPATPAPAAAMPVPVPAPAMIPRPRPVARSNWMRD